MDSLCAPTRFSGCLHTSQGSSMIKILQQASSTSECVQAAPEAMPESMLFCQAILLGLAQGLCRMKSLDSFSEQHR